MTLGEVLRAAAEYLGRKGVDAPRLDAELLLARALGLSRIELYTQHDRPLSEEERAAARALVERRGRREPLAYVLGEWGFRRLTLKTDARALVPRPETEIVVERALALVAGFDAPRVVDVGTGTGAIALAIADERPAARVVATDASEAALELARENAERLELSVELVAHQSARRPRRARSTSSSPTRRTSSQLSWPTSEPEVRDWEPRLATVDDGQTGELVQAAAKVLGPGGWIVLEVHERRAAEIAARLSDAGYADATITRDLAGRERVVEARWRAR